MNYNKIKKYLYNQTPLTILSFLSSRPGEIFSADEVSKATKSSRGATSQTLRLLLGLDILSREKKGNLFLYKLNAASPALKYFKIFENLLMLQKLTAEIQKYCYQIILFGSRSDGSNAANSDIDLFVKTEHKKKVRDIINKYESPDIRYQIVMLSPLEFASSKNQDSVFYNQVKKGIVLWEGRPAYE